MVDALAYIDAFDKVHGSADLQTGPPPRAWLAPLLGWIKINCDPAISPSGAVGLACCAWDSLGALVSARAKFLEVSLSV